jgi:hypothetical protein
MELDSNSETNVDSDSDIEVIHSTSAFDAQSAKVGPSSESTELRKKDAVDLRADIQERQHGLFKHFTAISRDQHLEELRKASASDRERCEEIREREKYEQLVLEATRGEWKRERNRDRKRAQRAREKAAVCLHLTLLGHC